MKDISCRIIGLTDLSAPFIDDEMLRADLENEQETIRRYRERIRQSEVMGEFALSEALRKIIAQEQDHAIDLSAALGIDVPRTEAENSSGGKTGGAD